MPKKNRFPPEAETQPGASRSKTPVGRTSGPAPKSKRERSEVPTLPPPKSKRGKTPDPRTSGVKSKRPPRQSDGARDGGASVDEVVADMTKDPRRERDE